jgi:vanillate O-demethylase monooxygenase subunit
MCEHRPCEKGASVDGQAEEDAADLVAPEVRTTFLRSDWEILARCWYPVVRDADLGTDPTGVVLLDQELVIYRAGSEVVIALDICPHRGVPLSAGKGDGESVQCAYHGLRFAGAGDCVHVPAHPAAKIPTRLRLQTFPAQLRFGLWWTCLRPNPAAAPDIPSMRGWDEPGYQLLTCPGFDIAAFAGRQVEGFIDVGHFAFVHTETFADPADVEVPAYNPVATESGFSADYWSTVANFPHGSGLSAPDGFRWLRRFEVHLPFTAGLVVHFPDDGRLSILNAASPVSARWTRMFCSIAKNFAVDQPESEILAFNERIFTEDRRIVEIQRPENLPLDPRIEVNIPADRSSVAYRRGLRAMGLSQFFTA